MGLAYPRAIFPFGLDSMPSFNPKSFTSVDRLRTISAAHLISFFSEWNAYFRQRGLDLETVSADAFPYDQVANILLQPDANVPEELIDALFYVHETANPHAMNELLNKAKAAGIELEYGPTSSESDISIQIWLKQPNLLQRQHAETLAFERSNFVYFAGSRSGHKSGALLVFSEAMLSPLQNTLDDWFEQKRRGRNSRVFAFSRGRKTWFLVRHGMPLRREGKHQEVGESGIAVYQPLRHDVLIYDGETDEIGVNAMTKGERNLYLEAFGEAQFGSKSHFDPSTRYTLDPLRKVGPESMSCDDIDGLNGVKFIEFGRIWLGKVAETEVRRADDLYKAYGDKWGERLGGGRLTHATSQFEFEGSRRKRSVTIRPANIAKYDRDSDEEVIETWLKARGFWVHSDEGDDADSEVLDGA